MDSTFQPAPSSQTKITYRLVHENGTTSSDYTVDPRPELPTQFAERVEVIETQQS